MGVYIKELTLDQVKSLFDMIGGKSLGESITPHLTEVAEPHGDLVDRKNFVAKLEFMRRTSKDNIVQEAVLRKMIEMVEEENVVIGGSTK